jgi:hypothetical protein
MATTKSAKVTFEKVVQHYEQYLAGRKCEGEGNFRKIRGFFSDYNKNFPFFGIRNKNNVLIIEFCVENGKNTPLHTAIKHEKYWKKICIFDKEVKCNSKYPTGGHLSIECEYSCSVQELCAYISEFIYQVKSRIESMIGGSK